MSDIFRDEFLPSIEAATISFAEWKKQQPNEYKAWTTYKNAVLAGDLPEPPTPKSRFGKALMAVGHMAERTDMKTTIVMASSPLVGSVGITAQFTPTDKVTRAEFWIDNVLVFTDTSAPFTYTWNTVNVADGNHVIVVKGFYPRNQITQAQVTRVVDNEPDTPPPPPPPIQDPPVNTTPPAISGTATQGQLLTVSQGEWTNSPDRYGHQWTRCDAAGANCSPILTATGWSYQLTADDVGDTIRCWTTAYNSVGPSAPILSAQTAVVTGVAAAVPVNVTAPVITGNPIVGNQLAVSNGSWTQSPTSYTRQWKRSSAIGEADILTDPDSGNANLLVAQSAVLAANATVQKLSFYVVQPDGLLRLGIYDDAGSRPGTLKASTPEFTPVAGWNDVYVTTPTALTAGTYWLAYLSNSNNLSFRKTVDGTSSLCLYAYNYGSLPTTFSATHSTSPSHFSFFATMSGGSSSNISGATSSTYTLVAADVGSSITCAVVAVNASGNSTAKESSPTAVVTADPITPPPPPPPPPTGNAYFKVDYNANHDFRHPWTTLFSYTNPGFVAVDSATGGTPTAATADGRVAVVLSPDGVNYAARFEIRDVDPGWPSNTANQKSEVRSIPSYTFNGPFSMGKEVWVGTRIWMPYSATGEQFNWPTSGADTFTTIAGFHPASSQNTGTFSIEWYAGSQWVVSRINFAPHPRPQLWRLLNADGSRYMANYNRWISFVTGVRFAPDSSGWLEFWVDGVNVLPRLNIQTAYNDETGPYYKHGLYKTKSGVMPTGKSVIYHRDTRIGANRADVM